MTILRIYISVLLLLGSLAGGAQVRPDQFPLEAEPNNSNFEVYSQKNGVNTRASMDGMKKYMVPGIDAAWKAFTLTDTTGIVDSLRMKMIKDNRGRIFYIDADGDALLLKDTAQAVGNVYALATLADTSTVTSPVEGDIAVVGSDTLLFYEAYWLMFAGGAGPDNAGIFDATNDGDTTAIGSIVLGEDMTVDMNGYDWLFDGLVEDDTTRKILTLRGDGSLAYRWLDSLLNGYTTGSGTAGTLPIWTGANALGNSSLSEASGVLSSSLTGALKLPAGTDAQDPVWSAGMLRYNTTANGIQGYDGTAERYLPWADADNFATNRIPFSNGSNLTSSGNFYFTSDRLYVGTSSLLFVGPTSGTPSVNIGTSSTSGNNSVAIGGGAVSSSFGSVAIGRGANSAGSDTNISIGMEAESLGSGCTTIGYRSKTLSSNYSVALSRGSTINQNNTLVAGGRGASTSIAITSIYFGTGIRAGYFEGSTSTVEQPGASYTIHGSGGGTTNQAGGNVTIAGGRGSGTGNPGDVIFSTSTTEASGTTFQTLTNRVWVKGNTGTLSIGTSSPDASAQMQIESTTRGFLPPRMTTAERDAIGSPAAGLVIFNTTTTKLECYDGTTWQAAW